MSKGDYISNQPAFKMGLNKWETFVRSNKEPYDFSTAVYAGMHKKVSYSCLLHGALEATPANILKGTRCKLCWNKRNSARLRLTQTEFLNRAKKKHGARYDYSQVVYITQYDKVSISCPVHGVFEQKAEFHMNGSGCSKCAILKQTQDQTDNLESFTLKLLEKWGSLWDVSDSVYTKSGETIIVKCVEHGQLCETKPNWLLNGQNPCTKCNHMRSAAEDAIADYINSLGVVVERRNREMLAPKEIDIWLPELKIGIEHHGLYWHVDKPKMHREKWEAAQKADIRLIQIFEDEWLNKEGLIKERLKAIVGKAKRVYARTLTLKGLPFKEAKPFLEKHHIQGAGISGVCIGLFDKEELLALGVFGKSRTGAMTSSAASKWEILRFASQGSVVGGFARILKDFIARYKPQEIISYCDLRYGTGNLYAQNGFTLTHITKPDYWWADTQNRVRHSRYSVQKHRTGVPEKQWCENQGWKRIYGVGHQVWVLIPSLVSSN